MDTGYKVLVIDDEPFIRSLFETVLSENDCMVATCGSGREGVEVAGKGSFDLVITDINMPDLGGIDVLRSIKNQNPDIGVIVITGYASLETAMEALHLGADEYLKKPFEDFAGQVVQTILKTAQRYQLVRENRRLVSDLDQANHKLKKANVEFRRMIARISSIQQTSQLINGCADIDSVLEVAEDALKGFDVTSYAILLRDGSNKMKPAKSCNLINTDRFELTLGTGPISEAITFQMPALVPDYKEDPAYKAAPVIENDQETKEVLVLPMMAGGEPAGAIMVCGMLDGIQYEQETINAFSILASAVSAPLALAKMKMQKSDS